MVGREALGFDDGRRDERSWNKPGPSRTPAGGRPIARAFAGTAAMCATRIDAVEVFIAYRQARSAGSGILKSLALMRWLEEPPNSDQVNINSLLQRRCSDYASKTSRGREEARAENTKYLFRMNPIAV
jgi:hypothetical protein